MCSIDQDLIPLDSFGPVTSFGLWNPKGPLKFVSVSHLGPISYLDWNETYFFFFFFHFVYWKHCPMVSCPRRSSRSHKARVSWQKKHCFNDSGWLWDATNTHGNCLPKANVFVLNLTKEICVRVAWFHILVCLFFPGCSLSIGLSVVAAFRPIYNKHVWVNLSSHQRH